MSKVQENFDLDQYLPPDEMLKICQFGNYGEKES